MHNKIRVIQLSGFGEIFTEDREDIEVVVPLRLFRLPPSREGYSVINAARSGEYEELGSPNVGMAANSAVKLKSHQST